MPFPIEGSIFNLLTMPDVVVTQSGSEVLSNDTLNNILQDYNTSYETIWGYCVQPSGGLSGYPGPNFGSSSLSISLSSNPNIINGSQYVRPATVTGTGPIFVGLDFGSSKTINYIYVGDGTHYCMMNKYPVSDEPVSVFKSSNNSSWSIVDSAIYNGDFWGSLSNSRAIPITSTYSRYLGYHGRNLIQPNNTTHVNDRISSTCTTMFAYDTTISGVQDYEMKIDLGDIYDVFEVSITDNADLHKLRFPYSVSYSLEDFASSYKNYKYKLDHSFYWYEENSFERSPVPQNTVSPLTASSIPKYNSIIYNPNDGCLYLYYELKMYKFDLVTRTWLSLATNIYAINSNEITLDVKNNEIYGLGNTLWKYSIYKNDFTPISFQSSVLSGGTPTTVCYSSYNHSLYCGMLGSSVFAKYDIKTDTWSLVASSPTNSYFYRGCRTLFSSYNNCIYAVLSSSSSSNGVDLFYKYDINSNTWTNLLTYAGISGISLFFGELQMLEWALDTNRDIIHFFYNSSYGFLHTYSIRNNSWTGYPNSSKFGSPSIIDTGYRDASNNDARKQLGGLSSFCYVSSEDRIYSHAENYFAEITPSNSLDPNWNRHLRYSVPLSRLYSASYVLMDKVRYIKISVSSALCYPLMIKNLKVTPINSYFNSSAGLNLVETNVYENDDVSVINLTNNTNNVVYSGMAYIDDNIDGFFKISDAIDGTYTDGQLDFIFTDGLSPSSGYSLFIKHDFPSDVQKHISNVRLNVLLEGNKNV